MPAAINTKENTINPNFLGSEADELDIFSTAFLSSNMKITAMAILCQFFDRLGYTDSGKYTSTVVPLPAVLFNMIFPL